MFRCYARLFFFSLFSFEFRLLYTMGAVFVFLFGQLRIEEIIYAVCTFFLACPLRGAWDVTLRSRSVVF